MMRSVRVVDSHTGGEPTRVVLEGAPELGAGPLAERLDNLRSHFDEFRSAVVNEPRGSDPLVGALLLPPHRPDCDAGVIFFNNVGYLGMCGHGTIGLVATLAFARGLAPGSIALDTPVGPVKAQLHEDGEVSVENVVSYRAAREVSVQLDGAEVRGDIAWGGNWFYLVSDHALALDLKNVEALTEYTRGLRAALAAGGYPQVDHVELFGEPKAAGAHSRNFVLCPGNAYDRSPCGTGTSAKLACLAADGKLAEGEAWVQESVIGSRFVGRFRWSDRATGRVVPTISGRAYITGDASLRLDAEDPFCWGIRA
jgi:4-hydroxyproline epimerase